jgi:hypothetical protein
MKTLFKICLVSGFLLLPTIALAAALPKPFANVSCVEMILGGTKYMTLEIEQKSILVREWDQHQIISEDYYDIVRVQSAGGVILNVRANERNMSMGTNYKVLELSLSTLVNENHSTITINGGPARDLNCKL